jgi:hypothetical protein
LIFNPRATTGLTTTAPVVEHAARCKSLTLISALTNQGLVRFACHKDAINAPRFIDFMTTRAPRCC